MWAFLKSLDHGTGIKSIAKIPIKLKYHYNEIEVKAGEPIVIFIGHNGNFLLEKYINGNLYDTKDAIKQQDIFNKVNIDLNLLDEELRQKYDLIAKQYKKTNYNYCVMEPNRKEQVKECLIYSLLNTASFFTKQIGGKDNSLVAEIKNKLNIWFSGMWGTWQSLIRRKHDFKYIWYYLVEKHLSNIVDVIINESTKDKINNVVKNMIHISGPKYNKLRDNLAKKHNLPSGYAVANADELWAVSIEKFKILPIELKKTIIAMIF